MMTDRRQFRPHYNGSLRCEVENASHRMASLGRIHNVHAKVRLLKARVRELHYARQAAIRQAMAGTPWLRPGHWSYRAALGFCLVVFVVLAGTLAWVLFTSKLGG